MSRLLEVVEESDWSDEESKRFSNPLFDNFAHYAQHSTRNTVLSIAKVRREGRLVGVAPLTRLVKYRGTRLLAESSRRWMDAIMGPFTKKTTCLVDASFMAFRHEDPILSVDPADARAVRDAVIAHLKEQRDIDNIVISEPAGDAGWHWRAGFRPFLQLPLVSVDVEGCETFNDYLARIGNKRRRNARKERQLFTDSGASINLYAPPLSEDLARELHRSLLSSSRQNSDLLEIPFEDVMNSEPAFLAQRQWALVATVDNAIAGFFGFIPHAGVIHQCHGGLNYEHSKRIKAYPNLIHAAVEHAIENGYRKVTLGPLNNEAKRRAGTLEPVMSAFWCRDAPSRFLMNHFLLKRFQVYCSEVD